MNAAVKYIGGMLGTTILAGTLAGGMVLGINAGSPANASVSTPTTRTCAAFTRWNHHRTTANLTRMLTASKHAEPAVKTDVIVVYTEVRQNDWYDLPADVHFLAADCRAR